MVFMTLVVFVTLVAHDPGMACGVRDKWQGALCSTFRSKYALLVTPDVPTSILCDCYFNANYWFCKGLLKKYSNCTLFTLCTWVLLLLLLLLKVKSMINRLTIGHGDRYCMKTSVKKIGMACFFHGLAKQLFNHPLIFLWIVALG